mmetsp:Transcript_22256/g.51414  ORF Transcript_22256/g.51414 Transcript_22256/m.51414 type:complete len:342 (+) Transcript_22256:1616-2641(+)
MAACMTRSDAERAESAAACMDSCHVSSSEARLARSLSRVAASTCSPSACATVLAAAHASARAASAASQSASHRFKARSLSCERFVPVALATHARAVASRRATNARMASLYEALRVRASAVSRLTMRAASSSAASSVVIRRSSCKASMRAASASAAALTRISSRRIASARAASASARAASRSSRSCCAAPLSISRSSTVVVVSSTVVRSSRPSQSCGVDMALGSGSARRCVVMDRTRRNLHTMSSASAAHEGKVDRTTSVRAEPPPTPPSKCSPTSAEKPVATSIVSSASVTTATSALKSLVAFACVSSTVDTIERGSSPASSESMALTVTPSASARASGLS